MNLTLRPFFGCFLLVCAAPLQATSYYVSTGGQDSNPGTSVASPWRTLRKGLESLRAGDKLFVRGGVYEEVLGDATPIKIYPGTSSSRIVVRNYGTEKPVLKGLLWLSSPSYWTLNGLSVTWQDGIVSTKHMVKLVNGVGWSFSNAEVWGAKSYAGILVAGTVSNEPRNWRITGNIIHDTYPSNDSNQDQGIYCNTGNPNGRGLIERNVIYNITNGMGVKLGGPDPESIGTHNVTVRYNTIYNTSQNILVSWRSSGNQIYRNIFQKTGTNYSNIRGYQLVGQGNVAYDNVGYEAKSMFLNDPGYVGVQDGGNLFGLNPIFDRIATTGFHPTNEVVQPYGRFAGLTVP